MVSRRLDTQQEPVVCAVCGRSLLRGEQPNGFIDGNVTRQVCELCTTRAVHYGWVREGTETLRGPRSRERARSLVGRWRARPEELEARPNAEPEPPVVAEPPAQRRIHAVPTGVSQRAARGVELFNRSEHTRTIAGVGRSLGPPIVAVIASEHAPEVDVFVAWELCWYRYAVELEDEAHAVRLVAQGDELADLGGALAEPNAAADERGELALS